MFGRLSWPTLDKTFWLVVDNSSLFDATLILSCRYVSDACTAKYIGRSAAGNACISNALTSSEREKLRNQIVRLGARKLGAEAIAQLLERVTPWDGAQPPTKARSPCQEQSGCDVCAALKALIWIISVKRATCCAHALQARYKEKFHGTKIITWQHCIYGAETTNADASLLDMCADYETLYVATGQPLKTKISNQCQRLSGQIQA